MKKVVGGFTLTIISAVLILISLVLIAITDFRWRSGDTEGLIIFILGLASAAMSVYALVSCLKCKEESNLKTVTTITAVVTIIGAGIIAVKGLIESGIL